VDGNAGRILRITDKSSSGLKAVLDEVWTAPSSDEMINDDGNYNATLSFADQVCVRVSYMFTCFFRGGGGGGGKISRPQF
jgi:hypothetical protein